MNKKKYIAPAIEVIEMEVAPYMVAGSVMNGGEIGGDFDEEFDQELSNNRRGQWGNLWAED
jgi:hypothetical protein